VWRNEVGSAEVRNTFVRHLCPLKLCECKASDPLIVTSDDVEDPAKSDEVLVAYRAEPARAPRTKPWHTWQPKWLRIGQRGLKMPPPDSSTFSSNDWAVMVHSRRLTKACPPD
jgi:hypothetical protein